MVDLHDVARAYADNDPQLGSIARRAIGQAEARIRRLSSEVATIQQILDHAARVNGPLEAPRIVGGPLIPADEPNGLTEAEKAVINGIIDEALIPDPGLGPEEVVALVEKAGIPLGRRVAQPASVVGTMLYHAKRRRASALAHRALSTG